MEEIDLPPFEVYSKVCSLAGQSALREVYETIEPKENDSFADFPSESNALSGEIQFAETSAHWSVARRLYACPCCSTSINIGAEHVLLKIREPNVEYAHHHIHNLCFAGDVLPLMLDVEAIAVTKGARRNTHRRDRRHFRR